MNTPTPDIRHLPGQGRFETVVDGHTCELDYHLQGGLMLITHTGVPRPLEGRGLAAALVAHALTWARSQGLKVRPVCSYVQVYMRRHPAWQDLQG
jgi:uncharacterized protein